MKHDTPKHRPWTFMIYMAGDNGKIFDTKRGKLKLMAEMTTAGYKDLIEMGSVGTTDNVAITCLFDTQDATYSIEVRKGHGFADSVVHQIPEVDTGDPKTLRKFITQSAKAYPADHYALIIWNHGTGWLDVDHYAIVRTLGEESHSYPAIFRTTPQKLTEGDTTRPIAYDDSSKDFLDSHDLGEALAEAEKDAGIRLDLIGMDACLMAMIEGARELAPYADYFVSSQEVEPMAGWAYAPIVAALDRQPELTPAGLADTIVRTFTKSYGGATRVEETVTQSAVALAHTADTEALCKNLVDSILANPTVTLRRLVQQARDKALVFQDRSYRDLGDFAAQLAEIMEWENYPAVTTAAQALRDHLKARGEGAPVLLVGYLPAYERATGMSVYLPSYLPANQREQTLSIYRRLAFPQQTGWDRLQAWLFGEF